MRAEHRQPGLPGFPFRPAAAAEGEEGGEGAEGHINGDPLGQDTGKVVPASGDQGQYRLIPGKGAIGGGKNDQGLD